jgi:rsbT co-antagonist protein RsbR
MGNEAQPSRKRYWCSYLILCYRWLVWNFACGHIARITSRSNPDLSHTTSIVLPYLEQKWHLFWNVSTVILATTIAVLGLYLRIIETINTEAIKPIIVLFVALATAIALLLLWQNQARLTRALQQSQQTNKELQALQASLEAQIAERTRVLQEMLQTVEKQATEERQLRETLLQQQEVILGLSVPIIPVKDQVLVIPLIGLIDEHRLQQIQQRALQAINQFNAHTLILDITGIPAIDKQVATKLIQIAQAIRLLGARTFLVGIHPEVAHSIVRAGIELHHIQPFARLQDALAGIVK